MIPIFAKSLRLSEYRLLSADQVDYGRNTAYLVWASFTAVIDLLAVISMVPFGLFNLLFFSYQDSLLDVLELATGHHIIWSQSCTLSTNFAARNKATERSIWLAENDCDLNGYVDLWPWISVAQVLFINIFFDFIISWAGWIVRGAFWFLF